MGPPELIETMRREGFELSISRPRVVMQTDPESGRKLEPIEEVQIDVDEDYSGAVLEAARKMFRERIKLRGKGVRLLGVGVSGLEPAGRGQASLFEDPDETKSRRMARAADAVREKLGERAVTRARLLRKKKEGEDDDKEASSLPSVD